MADLALERGLPCNLDAERFVLAAVLLDNTRFPEVAAALNPEDFSLEKHNRIFASMKDLHDRSEAIDRVTLANELQARDQLISCDGVSYLVSLDEGMPRLANIKSYLRIVREKSWLRQIIFASQRLMDSALRDDGTKASVLAASGVEQLLQIGGSDSENRLTSAGEILWAPEGGIDRFLDGCANQTSALKTGFSVFDKMTGGLQPGELVVIAGRPSMGKTALALNVAAHAAVGKQRLSVAVFSLEMSRDAVLTRILCSAARVDARKLRAGRLNHDEKNRLALSAEELRGTRLFIIDNSDSTVLDMGARLRRLRLDGGVDLCVIDYLGLIGGHHKQDNRARELGEITRYLKLLIAKELHIPVVLLSQLSRAPENRADHRPILSDLRESGDIEQDADLVAFIFREELYSADPKFRGLAELLVAKQRNGATGRVNLLFQGEFTRFEDAPTPLRRSQK